MCDPWPGSGTSSDSHLTFIGQVVTLKVIASVHEFLVSNFYSNLSHFTIFKCCIQ